MNKHGFRQDPSHPNNAIKPALRFYERTHVDTVSIHLDEKDLLNISWRAASGCPFHRENTL